MRCAVCAAAGHGAFTPWAGMVYKNVVGRLVARIRYARSLSQAGLARELQKAGWDISRSEVSKIEGRIREVKDWQMMFLVRVLDARHESFYPKLDEKERFSDAFHKLMHKKTS